MHLRSVLTEINMELLLFLLLKSSLNVTPQYNGKRKQVDIMWLVWKQK